MTTVRQVQAAAKEREDLQRRDPLITDLQSRWDQLQQKHWAATQEHQEQLLQLNLRLQTAEVYVACEPCFLPATSDMEQSGRVSGCGPLRQARRRDPACRRRERRPLPGRAFNGARRAEYVLFTWPVALIMFLTERVAGVRRETPPTSSLRGGPTQVAGRPPGSGGAAGPPGCGQGQGTERERRWGRHEVLTRHLRVRSDGAHQAARAVASLQDDLRQLR